MRKISISKFKEGYRNFIKYIRSGGVVYVKVSTTEAGARFIGKTVLVTGGSSGIGFAITKQFLSEGAKVIITGRNKESLDKAKQKLNDNKLYTIQWDISDVSNIKTKLSEVINVIGNIDIFVNNAGVFEWAPWNVVTEEMYDKVNDINAKGLFFMCQAEGDFFVKNSKHGRIINICSIAGLMPGFNPYAVSKWSSVCITKGLAKSLVKNGVIINGIAPGNVVTNIHAQVRGKDVNDNAYMPTHPTGRYTLVEEIAELTTFLAGGASSNIVGQVIAVDGGWTLN